MPESRTTSWVRGGGRPWRAAGNVPGNGAVSRWTWGLRWRPPRTQVGRGRTPEPWKRGPTTSAVAVLLWFARLQFDTEFARYEIRFAGTVTGLNEGSPVRYSGVRVGEVIGVGLDHDDPSQVIVTIQVESTTPVREDTRASLEI